MLTIAGQVVNQFAGILATLCLMFAFGSFGAHAEDRPNIVIILADDQGWGDVGFNGNKNLSTPNIDSLAASGTVFDHFFVCPVCSPTRAEFLTGRYHPRSGVFSTSTGGERMNLAEKTLADSLKSAGYATGIFGKWHNGMQYPYHPMARGFERFYGYCSGHWGDYFDALLLDDNGALIPHGKGFLTDDLTGHALQFIEDNRERPFFCYLPLNTPHTPAQAPDRFYDKFAKAEIPMRDTVAGREDLAMTRAVLAMNENIDWNVGRVLDQIKRLKLDEKTIVIYFSDNGPNSWRWNGGMKGRKGSTDEGGLRVPFAIRWPGHINAGAKISHIAGAVDILPTLLDLTGVPRIGNLPLDGISLKSLITGGKAQEWSDRKIFSHWGNKVSVRTQRFRLDNEHHLYDMDADPGQKRDVATENPKITEELTQAVNAWKKDLLPGLGKQDWPYTVGYPEFPLTQLPARDGIAHGGVQRSAKAPNCSYFSQWTKAEGKITWNIEVATAGKYEAVIYYTCPKGETGSEVELGFNGSALRFTVDEAWDPTPYGAEHDRARRDSESFVKDFKPLRAGVIELKSGRGELTLRALKIPAHQVMDVRQICLKLLKE